MSTVIAIPHSAAAQAALAAKFFVAQLFLQHSFF
jgi:hypothetical protein